MNFPLIDESTDLEQAISCLKQGKIILYPTDTVWGLGCSTAYPEALSKLFEIKNRPENKSVILLVDSIQMLKKYIDHIHPRVETLMGFHNRPMTVIYKKARNLDPAFIAADGSVAIRVCSDPFCKSLIAALDTPLVSSSANLSDMPTPSNFMEIDPRIKDRVDYIVKFRQDDQTKNEPSSIIKFDREGELEFIRF